MNVECDAGDSTRTISTFPKPVTEVRIDGLRCGQATVMKASTPTVIPSAWHRGIDAAPSHPQRLARTSCRHGQPQQQVADHRQQTC